MNTVTWTERWWEFAVVVLAANSVVFGVIAAGNGYSAWAIATGFAPAVLLVTGLALRARSRSGATVLVIVASGAAAAWFWMIYPMALAAVVVIGGLARGEIGPERVQAHPAV